MELSQKTKDRASKLIADTEDMLDEFFRSDYSSTPPSFYKYLRDFNAKLAEAKTVIEYYKPILEDIPFHGLKPKQLRPYENFLRQIIADTTAYLDNTRAPTKPRKKKAKSADKIAAKVKYLAAYDDLKLVSIPPSHIVGANAVWLYNVKTRKLTYLTGKSLDSQLTIKGTTVLDFDPENSGTKVLRKPEKTLPTLLNSTRGKTKLEFDNLSTNATPANGRISADVIILKTYK